MDEIQADEVARPSWEERKQLQKDIQNLRAGHTGAYLIAEFKVYGLIGSRGAFINDLSNLRVKSFSQESYDRLYQLRQEYMKLRLLL